MGFKIIVVASLAAVTFTKPIPDPVHVIRQSGPAAGQIITRCSAPGQIALTYDDGPTQYTQKLVNTLNAGDAKATFFVTGTLDGCIYNRRAALNDAYQSGHQIAAHSWSHPSNFGSLSSTELEAQMTRLEQALVNIIGVKPTYMRPPYLATGGDVLPTMKKLGYRVITADIDSGDWNKQTPEQSQQKFVTAGPDGNGHIPLMHETYTSTVDTLTPWLIKWAQNNNLRMVTVAECLGDKTSAYKIGTPSNASSC